MAYYVCTSNQYTVWYIQLWDKAMVLQCVSHLVMDEFSLNRRTGDY